MITSENKVLLIMDGDNLKKIVTVGDVSVFHAYPDSLQEELTSDLNTPLDVDGSDLIEKLSVKDFETFISDLKSKSITTNG